MSCPSETIDRPRNINVARALLKLKKHNDGAPFVVMAWMLNKDIIDESGNVDNLYGCCIDMGHYRTYEDAEKRCKEVIVITGHDAVRVIKLGQPLPLTMKLDPTYGDIKDIPVDSQGNFITLAEKQVEERNRLMEERIKLEKEIVQEQIDILDPGHIEHFKHQVYIAVQGFQKISAHENYIREQKRAVIDAVTKLRKYYHYHTDNEENWLEWYEAKLSTRNEMNIYEVVSNMYERHRNAFLGLEGEDILDMLDIEVDSDSGSDTEDKVTPEVVQEEETVESSDEGELCDDVVLEENNMIKDAPTPDPCCTDGVCFIPQEVQEVEEPKKLSKNARRKLRRKNAADNSGETSE